VLFPRLERIPATRCIGSGDRSISISGAMNRVPDAAELVAHQRWIRALARTLVVDASAADDLVQDTWVAALEHGPRPDPPRRGWLATILRRRAAETRRESASRARREASSARAEALPSTLAMIERAAVQRDLVQAVLDLEEPYRTTILWRFFEELPPREIARRAGAPVATVHSRIQRGLDEAAPSSSTTTAAATGARGRWRWLHSSGPESPDRLAWEPFS
jgi:RNA polymerase sigma-70 factor (ECF subfamily)